MSGLSRTPGKRVYVAIAYRGFESHSLRHNMHSASMRGGLQKKG